MPKQSNSTKRHLIGWDDNNHNNGITSSEYETTSDNSEIDVSDDFDLGSSIDEAIRTENIGCFSKDYKDVKRIVHISGDPEFSAVRKLDNEHCFLYLVPYTKEDYNKLRKLKIEASKCPYLLNFSRIELAEDFILLEAPYEKNMLHIFDEMNPDYGLISDVYRDNFDEATIRTILSDVLQATQFLHNLGYIHTAVRAASLYVNSEGLVLLGNLHLIRNSNELSIVTPMAHMAPEMIAKLPKLKIQESLLVGLRSGFSFKSDCWSIGMFVIELVSLLDIDEFFDRTFMNLTDNRLATKILKMEFPTIHVMGKAMNRTLSPFLKDFTYRCLNSNSMNGRWSINRLLKAHKFMKPDRKPDNSIVSKPKSGRHSRRKIESSKKSNTARKSLNYPML